MNPRKTGPVTHRSVTPELTRFRRSAAMSDPRVTRYVIGENVHPLRGARAHAHAGAHPHTHKGVPYLSNYVTEVEEKKKDQVKHPLPRYADRYAAATQRVTPTPSSPDRTEVTHA